MNTDRKGTRLAAPCAFPKFTARLLTIRRLVVMTCSPLLVAVSATLLLISSTSGEVRKEEPKTQTIPLDQIWGYNLPGTRDIAGVKFPEVPQGVGRTYGFLRQERDYNIEQIRRALASKPPAEKALSGFVMSGQPDSRTLLAMHPQLRGKPGPLQRNFPKGEYTLVFFSHPLSYYARLREVERGDNKISVLYQFEPHTTPEATVHFALIPLGKLKAGRYEVDYQQIPLDQKYRDAGFEPVHPEAAEIVSRDFSFTVGEPIAIEPIEGATLIPLDQIWTYGMGETRNYRKPTGLVDQPTIDAVEKIIDKRSYGREMPGAAFVVTGTGKDVLRRMLAGFQQSEQSFAAESELNLVFYTHQSGAHYIRIERIELAGNQIVVSYRPTLHETGDSSFHFAVIPLGKLPAGDYDVTIQQLPPVNGYGRPVELRDLSDLVCGDTSFRVKGDGS